MCTVLSFLAPVGVILTTLPSSGHENIHQLNRRVWADSGGICKAEHKISHTKYRYIHVDQQRSPNLSFAQNQMQTLMNLLFLLLHLTFLLAVTAEQEGCLKSQDRSVSSQGRVERRRENDEGSETHSPANPHN